MSLDGNKALEFEAQAKELDAKARAATDPAIRDECRAAAEAYRALAKLSRVVAPHAPDKSKVREA